MAAVYPVVTFVPAQAVFATAAPMPQEWMPTAAPPPAPMSTEAPPPPVSSESATAAGRRRGGRSGQKTAPPPQRQCAVVFKKTSICRYFPKCHQGDSCKFAHTTDELRVRPNLTKTRMCAGYADGRCKLPAEECGFAHGEHDLRPREVPYFTDPLPAGFGAPKRGDRAPAAQKPQSPADSAKTAVLSLSAETLASYDAYATSTGSSSPPQSAAALSRSGSETPRTLLDDCDVQEETLSLPAPHGMDSMQGQLAGEVDASQVDVLVRQWLEDIRTASGSSKEHMPGFFQAPDECRAALVSAMPEYYED